MPRGKGKKRIMLEERIVKPTDEQLASGLYVPADIIHADTGKRAGVHKALHDPVERWIASGRLSDTQEAAIKLVRRLWGILGRNPKVTALYGERIGGQSDREEAIMVHVEAKEDMARIKGYFPDKYWDCFENVCRWGQAAGVAGAELGYGTRSAQDRAHTIVCFVADFIASKERV